MRSQGYLFTGPWQAQWEDVDVSEDLKPTEALVEVTHSVVSAGTDVSIYTGTHRNIANPEAQWPRYPHRPGGHSSAVVLSVGRQVDGLKPGDRIVTMSTRLAGHAVLDTATAIYQRLPDDVPPDLAPLASHSTVPINAIRLADLKLGETVAVFGLGLIGQYAVQYAKIAGADRVFAVDPLAGRRAVAAQNGADVTIDPTADEAQREIAALTGGGAEVVIEASGAGAAIGPALKAAARFGRVVLLGSTRSDVNVDIYNDIHRKGVSVIGSNPTPDVGNPQYPWTRARNLRVALSLLGQHRLRLDNLVSHRLLAADAGDIFDRLAKQPQNYLGVTLAWR
ncbi:MAG: zinc-dependent alcohol dehydrogenase [Anaerolineae bacterium]